MLVQTIRSAAHMRDEFQRFGRKDQFSYDDYEYLYAYLWDRGQELERPEDFCVVSICCEWCEYNSLQELAEQCGLEDIEDADEIVDAMEKRGTLIRMDGGGVLFSE